MLKDDRIIKRYSEGFRKKVLLELENGKYNKREVINLYGINPATLYDWIRKHNKPNLLNKRIRIETMDEKDKIKELEKRINELKELLVQKDLKLFENDVYLEVLAEHLGYSDVNELKKNLEADHSSKPSKGEKKKD
jgi:transposase-like protein